MACRVSGTRLNRRTVGAAGAVVAVVAAIVGFGVGSDQFGRLANSPPQGSVSTSTSTTTLPEREAQRMLVLFDSTGEWTTLAQTDAMQSANLLGHFGPVDRRPVQSYTSGLMGQYDGVVYEGTTFDEPLPSVFLDDVAQSGTPVVWAALNISQMSSRLESGGYGFTTGALDPRPMAKVVYDGVDLNRFDSGEYNQITRINITDPTVAEPLGHVVAEDGSELVWAVRSGALTYVSESPYSYASEGDRYLAWADVLLGAFTPDASERHRALVRLEDIGPASDPKLLRASIDVLVERDIPFTMAVYPEFVDPDAQHGTPYGSPGTPALRLDQRPMVVAVIQYGIDHGGIIVSHGLTHQYRTDPNPYGGVSGDDYEFYAASIDARTDNVVLDGPVAEDSVAWATERLRDARTMLIRAGLPSSAVRMFEPAHYAASEATYEAIGDVYAGLNGTGPATRFDRGMYFPELASGTADIEHAFGQFFPYAVRDVYGHLVVPENLGNVIKVGGNNNDARTPTQIVEDARRSLVVRDGVVGFYFHPYLEATLLEQVVDGIENAGFEFVPSTSITTGWDMTAVPEDASGSPR